MTTAESGMHPAFASVGAKWRRALARRQELIESIEAWNLPGHVELANAVFDDEGRRIGILARLRGATAAGLGSRRI
ncbi:hypothetical protein ACFFKU_13030 [Kineococcus gynurae]|uniref:Uncharacterized protein n=1 Tax=Kineococcus gynurae TaxID=452979 RepID=A0ABV5LQF1_9ACTN